MFLYICLCCICANFVCSTFLFLETKHLKGGWHDNEDQERDRYGDGLSSESACAGSEDKTGIQQLVMMRSAWVTVCHCSVCLFVLMLHKKTGLQAITCTQINHQRGSYECNHQMWNIMSEKSSAYFLFSTYLRSFPARTLITSSCLCIKLRAGTGMRLA